MTKRKTAFAVAAIIIVALVILIAVNATKHKSPENAQPSQSTSASASPSATQDNEDSSSDNATPGQDSTAAAPTTDAVVPGTALRSVHSPGAVVNDISLSAGQCHIKTVDAANGKYLPDAACTPGAIDPAVTQDNIESTICKSGYTETIRPSASNTNTYKKLSLSEYGVKSSSTVEYDHLISLQLGGTNAVSNLWVEPNKASATGTTNPKDTVETKLKVAVCNHTVTLAKAQQAIATDWTTAESKLGLK